MPVLEVDGVQFAQSNALVFYAASLSGLTPKDDVGILHVNDILSSVGDCLTTILTLRTEQDAEKAKVLAQGFVAADGTEVRKCRTLHHV